MHVENAISCFAEAHVFLVFVLDGESILFRIYKRVKIEESNTSICVLCWSWVYTYIVACMVMWVSTFFVMSF